MQKLHWTRRLWHVGRSDHIHKEPTHPQPSSVYCRSISGARNPLPTNREHLKRNRSCRLCTLSRTSLAATLRRHRHAPQRRPNHQPKRRQPNPFTKHHCSFPRTLPLTTTNAPKPLRHLHPTNATCCRIFTSFSADRHHRNNPPTCPPQSIPPCPTSPSGPPHLAYPSEFPAILCKMSALYFS